MIQVDSKEQLDEQLGKYEKALALFYASWCPYCTGFVPSFKKAVAHLHSTTVIYVLLDDYDNPLWDDYSIGAVPTVIYFEKGKVSKRLDGEFGIGLKTKEFTDWLEESKL